MEKVKKETKELTKVEEPIGITQRQASLIYERTPKKYIKKRPGRGGKVFDYVETGYIIKRLNQIFNYLWEFKVVEHQIGKEQVWVKGELTAHISPSLSITKSQYGGSDIKRNKDGEVIDIADDLKAATSDALKKCASLFGIASDVYWGGEKEEIKEEDCDVDHDKLPWREVKKEGKNKGRKFKTCPKCGYFRWKEEK